MSIISRIVVSSVSVFAAAALLAGPAAASTTSVVLESISGPVVTRPIPFPIRPCGPILRPIGVLHSLASPSVVMCPLSA